MGRNRFRTDHTNCMPGPELCGQFFAVLGVRKCPQFGVDVRLENENAQGCLSAGIRPAKLRLLSYGYIVASNVRFGSLADISRSTSYVRFGSLRVVPNFFYRSLNFFCRLIETFAPTS